MIQNGPERQLSSFPHFKDLKADGFVFGSVLKFQVQIPKALGFGQLPDTTMRTCTSKDFMVTVLQTVKASVYKQGTHTSRHTSTRVTCVHI